MAGKAIGGKGWPVWWLAGLAMGKVEEGEKEAA
mgnify:FL=1|jgi:hypothetical protein